MQLPAHLRQFGPRVLFVLACFAGAVEPPASSTAQDDAPSRDQLTADFAHATRVARQTAYDAILARNDRELTEAALKRRWDAALVEVANNATVKQLQRLADDRRALDAARKAALDLIFDEKEYFYPYNPPECPPEKVALYAPVQKRVDELVAAVRKALDRSRPVKFASGFATVREELDWNLARQKEQKLKFKLSDSVPEFVAVMPTDIKEITLAEFAWNAADAAEIAYSHKVVAYNERLWHELEHAKPAPDVPDAGERDQVRITNAYRILLGRRALAWNPKLQASAQGHSDYMSKTGILGHFEEGDEARKTPGDRMKLAGYRLGVGENCSEGRDDAKGAHEGWCGSSGHHRDLLMEDHREMASAVAGRFWTQNFGMGKEFVAKL